MKLRCSMGSPFARKAAMAVHALGLADRIELIEHDADKSNAIRHVNPLHKVPMLLADDGTAIFDSPVILEYLDEIAGGGKLFPPRGIERYRTLSRLALADGISEAAVLIHYEDRWREPGQKSQRWIDHQRGKIVRALTVFENDLPQSFDAVAMGLFCAVNFLERSKDWDWRSHAPNVEAWFDHVRSSEPSVIVTEPKAA